MWNGLGEQALIEDLLAELRSQYKGNAACSAADMSKSGDIAAMVAQAARDVLLAQAASERGQQLPVRLLPSAALSARSAWRTHSSASATAA